MKENGINKLIKLLNEYEAKRYKTSVDETTYICSDIWNGVIVPVPCGYPEYKETECENKSDF